MKKQLLLVLAGLTTAVQLFAQEPQTKLQLPSTSLNNTVASEKGEGEIIGVITDEGSNAPIEFATVALVDKVSGITVESTITDAKGKFRIQQILPGQYKLKISSIGYKAKTLEMITLEHTEEMNVGGVSLEGNANAYHHDNG